MAELIESPVRVEAAGEPPKRIEEFAGRASNGEQRVERRAHALAGRLERAGPAAGVRRVHRRTGGWIAGGDRERDLRGRRPARACWCAAASGCATRRPRASRIRRRVPAGLLARDRPSRRRENTGANVGGREPRRPVLPLRAARPDLVEHLGGDQVRPRGQPGAAGRGPALRAGRGVLLAFAALQRRPLRTDWLLVGVLAAMPFALGLRARLLGRAVHPLGPGGGAVRSAPALHRDPRRHLPARGAAAGSAGAGRGHRDRRPGTQLCREPESRRRGPRSGGSRGARAGAARRLDRQRRPEAARPQPRRGRP